MGGFFVIGFAAIVAGLVAFGHFQATRDVPLLTTTKAAALGQRFMVYRNAVLTFVQDNPGFVGTVMPEQLVLPPGLTIAAIPVGASNQIVSDGTGGFNIDVWCPGTPAALAQLAVATEGDASFGYTENGNFDTPEFGIMGAAPTAVPNGDLLSEVRIGN